MYPQEFIPLKLSLFLLNLSSSKNVRLTKHKFRHNSAIEDATQLNSVVIRAEKSTVEIKPMSNVGQDMLVKGGTVSDVLGKLPSVSVD
jgi:hypothetical protein